MILMISRGFHRRKDREAKQELDFDDEGEDIQSQVENPERPVTEQPGPEIEKEDARKPLLSRIWHAITRR